jgi:hypothetical protein
MPQNKQTVTNEMIWNLLLQIQSQQAEINSRLIAIERAEHIVYADEDSADSVAADAAIGDGDEDIDDEYDEDEDGDRHDGFADDTEFLMSNPKNWARLVQAAKDNDEGRNLVQVPIEWFRR